MCVGHKTMAGRSPGLGRAPIIVYENALPAPESMQTPGFSTGRRLFSPSPGQQQNDMSGRDLGCDERVDNSATI